MGRRGLRTLHACVLFCALGLITTDIQCQSRYKDDVNQRQGLARALLRLTNETAVAGEAEQQMQAPEASTGVTPQAAELSALASKLYPWSSSVNGSWPMGSALPNITCEPKGIALVVVAAHGDSLWEHVMRWMAVANRNAYAATHGYSVYVSSAQLHSRPPTWQKFLLAQAAFCHSCPEYIWLLDSDAFIMNLGLRLEDALPEVFSKPPEQRPDVVVAKDCHGLNAGSLLLRHTPWTLQHLADAWAATWVKDAADWHEQAALMHLTNHYPEVAAHYLFVPQRTINSYPRECINCNTGPYQEGDLVLHFVDDSKHRELNLKSDYLNRIPILGPDEHVSSSSSSSSSSSKKTAQDTPQHHRKGTAALDADCTPADTVNRDGGAAGKSNSNKNGVVGDGGSDSEGREGGNATQSGSAGSETSPAAEASSGDNKEQDAPGSSSSISSISSSGSSGSSGSRAHMHHPSYGIWPADADLNTWPAVKHAHGSTSKVRVELKSKLDAFEQHAVDEQYLFVADPFNGNPGWPLVMPKLLRSVLAASHRHGHSYEESGTAVPRQKPADSA